MEPIKAESHQTANQTTEPMNDFIELQINPLEECKDEECRKCETKTNEQRDESGPKEEEKSSEIEHKLKEATDTTIIINESVSDSCEKAAIKPGKSTGNVEKSVRNSRVLWVYNIADDDKAIDLKCHFSQYGVVDSAKIITDGVNYFGYIVMHNKDDAAHCLRDCRNTLYKDRAVTLHAIGPKHVTGATKTNEAEAVVQKSNEKRGSSTACGNTTSQITSGVAGAGSDASRACVRRSKSRSRSLRNKDAEWLRIKVELERQRKERDRQRYKARELSERQMQLKIDAKKLEIEREQFEKQRQQVLRMDYLQKKLERERLQVEEMKLKLRNALVEEKKQVVKKGDNVKEYAKSGVNRYAAEYRRSLSKGKTDRFVQSPPPPPKLTKTMDRVTERQKRWPEGQREKKYEMGARNTKHDAYNKDRNNKGFVPSRKHAHRSSKSDYDDRSSDFGSKYNGNNDDNGRKLFFTQRRGNEEETTTGEKMQCGAYPLKTYPSFRNTSSSSSSMRFNDAPTIENVPMMNASTNVHHRINYPTATYGIATLQPPSYYYTPANNMSDYLRKY